jgi:phenylacetate-CoA ligase
MLKRAFWSPWKLEKYQNENLRKVVRYAYANVLFYRRKFREAGIKPEDVKTVSDLSKLPIIRRRDIRENLRDFISRKYDMTSLKMLRTSGSTGQPLFLYISSTENYFRKAKHLRANITCGQKPWDKWVVITSPHHFGEVSKLQRTLGIYAPVSVSVFEDVKQQVSILEKIKPDILDGYSSSLYLLAKELKGCGHKGIKPKFIIGGAELIDSSQIKLIEEVFNVPFYDQYACIEVERIAWQCPERIGYHLDADTVIIQFVDEDGEEVSLGETGEIVCTSLFNFAMPLIRYAVGDIGTPNNERCTCGRSFPLMKMVEGRKDSLIFLSDGRILSPRVFTIAISTFRFYKVIDQYRIVQRKKDLFEIFVKIKDNAVNVDVFERELVKHLRKTINIPADLADFKINFVEKIPLDKSGKFTIVISELSKSV